MALISADPAGGLWLWENGREEVKIVYDSRDFNFYIVIQYIYPRKNNSDVANKHIERRTCFTLLLYV